MAGITSPGWFSVFALGCTRAITTDLGIRAAFVLAAAIYAMITVGLVTIPICTTFFSTYAIAIDARFTRWTTSPTVTISYALLAFPVTTARTRRRPGQGRAGKEK